MTRILLSLVLLLCLTTYAHATPQHAIAMHGAPKYAADFDHLDYVNKDAPKGGDLRLAASGSFDNLNSLVITGTPAKGLEYVNDQLMQRVWDEPFTLYGLVAEKIDVSPDRSQVTFYLNPTARFHDDHPMTTEDVKFSFDMYLKHGHPVRRRVYGLVEDIRIIDDRTISFKFGKGYDPESVMILALLHVLPKHYWETRDITKTTLQPPLGSGPYKIKSIDPGRKIVYERALDYWAKDLPVNRGMYNFDTLTYTYFRDDSVALQAFKSGEYNLRREYDITKWRIGYDSKALAEGRIVQEEIAHHRPEWLRALVFNTRRPMFADLKVRRALAQMFNGEWLNKTLYLGAYRRIESAFPNSELAAAGRPEGEELRILQQYAADLPEDVFGDVFSAPSGDSRDNKRKAITLLKEAGWAYQDGKLVNDKGDAFSFEILLGDPGDEKIALEFARALKAIGADVQVRTVDSAQFTGRLDDFDYDMVSFRWVNSLSPGNEQLNYWGSAAADTAGSRNYAGIRNKAVDALADSIARAGDRESLVAHARALDRALMQGYYMIPLFYLGKDLVAHASDIGRPAITPAYGVVLESWWR